MILKSLAGAALILGGSMATTALASPAPQSPMAPLTFLTAADKEQTDSGAYCLALYENRTIFVTDLSLAVVRLAATPNQPSRMHLLDWIDVPEGQPQLARTRQFRAGARNGFIVSIHEIAGAKSRQVSEEEWSTPSRLVVKNAAGTVLGNLKIDWRCGA